MSTHQSQYIWHGGNGITAICNNLLSLLTVKGLSVNGFAKQSLMQ